MSVAKLCFGCEAFTRWLCAVAADPAFDRHSHRGREVGRFRHPKDPKMMTLSQDTCDFCSFLLQAKGFSRFRDTEECVAVELQAAKCWENHIPLVNIDYLNQSGSSVEARIHIWADSGSEAHTEGKISPIAPLKSHGVQQTAKLVQKWLRWCYSTHPDCRDSIAAEVIDEELSPIPASRILDVGGHPADLVKLVETKDILGRYCALSHCWGPADKRPPCVTLDNQNRYLEGVSITSLSKTFTDAIVLTRALGIRYLWIDSLCIIQDSTEHWLQESARMGAVYERAYLRIAAAGASQSGEGLFGGEGRTPSEQIPEIRLPFYTAEGAVSGWFCSRICGKSWDPTWGPLNKRSWVFQEDRLSRRTVSFMPDSITWMCKSEGFNERNCVESSFGAYNPWSLWRVNITEYSSRHLTYETDRLAAIQGLANELAKTRSDQYLYGLWTGEMSHQLLWRIVKLEGCMEGLQHLPTWTWAHHPGEKQYTQDKRLSSEQHERSSSTLLSWELTSGKLTLRGRLMECRLRKDYSMGRAFDLEFDRFPELCIHLFEGQLLSVLHGGAHYLIWPDATDDEDPMGIVTLDKDGVHNNLRCAIMSVGKRNSACEAALNDSEDELHSDQERLLFKMLRRSCSKPHYYLVLVLAPAAEGDTFCRVGMGAIWPSEYVENRPADQIFHLV